MNPYQELPETAFWRTAVANNNMFDIKDLWEAKFRITRKDKIATFGSCFAQHIGQSLKQRGYNWFISETAPEGLSEGNKKKYNYDVFSCRTGNIYTTSLLKQWVEWSLGKSKVPEEFWEKDNRFFDPFRPNIEPNGFESVEEMNLSRIQTLKSFKQLLEESTVFIFTLGLTESWFHKQGNYEYPMCPGTVAGKFNKESHIFVNQSFSFIQNNLNEAIRMMREVNPKLRFILTVSPVPLTATNSGQHVLVATMASKSILRAIADQFSTTRKYIDYFPSYELINSPVYKGIFFEPNLRSVHKVGVSHVMAIFFNGLPSSVGTAKNSKNQKPITDHKKSDDVVCEEELLAAFSSNK